MIRAMDPNGPQGLRLTHRSADSKFTSLPGNRSRRTCVGLELARPTPRRGLHQPSHHPTPALVVDLQTHPTAGECREVLQGLSDGRV